MTITTDSGYENLVNLSPFAYRGYCYDNDIKMYYLQSRYYDPQICRFINADSSEYLGATGTVLSCNLFAYCENDPVGSIDFDGKYDRKKVLKYIERWTGKTNKNIFLRNPLFRPYGEDCANFASQCLNAGGIKMTSTWYNYFGPIIQVISKYNHQIIGYGYQVTTVWSTVSGLMGFLSSSTKYLQQVSYHCFSDIKKGNVNNEIKKFIAFAGILQVGDIMFLDLEADGEEEYHHATIISKMSKNEIYYAAHSSNRYQYPLSSMIFKNGSLYVERVLIYSIKNNAS